MDKPVDAQSEQDELVMKGTPAFRKGCDVCRGSGTIEYEDSDHTHKDDCWKCGGDGFIIESKPLGCGKNPKCKGVFREDGHNWVCGEHRICPSCQKQRGDGK
jgi:hypothetical protein